MKRRELEKRLRELGWRFLRHGGRHDIWTNGELEEPLQRHNEIAETIARKTLKKALCNPPPDKQGGENV